MPTIVIVEDDELVREIAARALEGAGHSVIPVADGLDAIDCVWESDPDLVILDCALPGKGGLPILQELRASPKFRTIPVLILTARRSDWHAQLAMDTGASDYLRKPFKMEDLLDSVSALLAKGGAVRPAIAHSGAAADHLIDAEYVVSLSASLGRQDTRALLTMMAATVDQSVQTLVAALKANARQRVLEEAHALAGAAMTIGAPRLAALCRAIERDPTDRDGVTGLLSATATATRDAIEQMLAERLAAPLADATP